MKTGALYDLLQELFGLGEEDNTSPWYQSRTLSIGKLNRMLKARHVSTDEVAEAAHYAYHQRIPITDFWQVFKLVPEALRARRQTLADSDVDTLRNARAVSIREALDLHNTAWAERLMRTPDTHLAAVLEEWRQHVEP